MKKIKITEILAVFVFFGFILISGFFPCRLSTPEKNVFFRVEPGDDAKKISINLENSGLISWSPLFKAYVLVTGKSKELKTGTYEISSLMSIPKIVNIIEKGVIAGERITIIEGWNLKDIGLYFEKVGLFGANDFWEIAGFPATDYSDTTTSLPFDFSSEYDFLREKPKNIGLDGYLFPDTYVVNIGAGPEEVIRQILDNFRGKLSPDLKESIKSQDKTLFDVLTMASLIENEARTGEDRRLVSGILWKRLKSRFPLQLCATVNYVLGKKGTDISIEETKIDSPYNTYKYAGLPLGPICNPSLDSIEAALNPKDSKYWYYLSTPNGEMMYSETLEEHNIKKAKYLK